MVIIKRSFQPSVSMSDKFTALYLACNSVGLKSFLVFQVRVASGYDLNGGITKRSVEIVTD